MSHNCQMCGKASSSCGSLYVIRVVELENGDHFNEGEGDCIPVVCTQCFKLFRQEIFEKCLR